MSSLEKPKNISNSPEELEKNITRKESEEEFGPTIPSEKKKKENKEKLQEEIEKLRQSLGI
jgi:hypothetical protein